MESSLPRQAPCTQVQAISVTVGRDKHRTEAWLPAAPLGFTSKGAGRLRCKVGRQHQRAVPDAGAHTEAGRCQCPRLHPAATTLEMQGCHVSHPKAPASSASANLLSAHCAGPASGQRGLFTCCCSASVLAGASSIMTRSAACVCQRLGPSSQAKTGWPSSHLHKDATRASSTATCALLLDKAGSCKARRKPTLPSSTASQQSCQSRLHTDNLCYLDDNSGVIR